MIFNSNFNFNLHQIDINLLVPGTGKIQSQQQGRSAPICDKVIIITDIDYWGGRG
jgi:hypothetical protein